MGRPLEGKRNSAAGLDSARFGTIPDGANALDCI
jgi:hypothetical protein